MQRGDELTVFQVSVQALLGRHISRSRQQRIPRVVGQL
jgi:hypothetical protein